MLFLISFLMSPCHTQSKYILVQSSSPSEQDISRKQISEKKRAFKWSLSIFGLLFSKLLSLKDNFCACVKDSHDLLLLAVILALALKIDMTIYLFSRILMGQWGHKHARTMLPACCCSAVLPMKLASDLHSVNTL